MGRGVRSEGASRDLRWTTRRHRRRGDRSCVHVKCCEIRVKTNANAGEGRSTRRGAAARWSSRVCCSVPLGWKDSTRKKKRSDRALSTWMRARAARCRRLVARSQKRAASSSCVVVASANNPSRPSPAPLSGRATRARRCRFRRMVPATAPFSSGRSVRRRPRPPRTRARATRSIPSSDSDDDGARVARPDGFHGVTPRGTSSSTR